MGKVRPEKAKEHEPYDNHSGSRIRKETRETREWAAEDQGGPLKTNERKVKGTVEKRHRDLDAFGHRRGLSIPGL